MYAIIETGGKQYRAEPGGILQVESLLGEVGSVVELPNVRLIQNNSTPILGYPTIPERSCQSRNSSTGANTIDPSVQEKTSKELSTDQRAPSGVYANPYFRNCLSILSQLVTEKTHGT